MTDEERAGGEGDELIEDLEAPAAAQSDVAGGYNACVTPTCKVNTISVYCRLPTCGATATDCTAASKTVVVFEQ